MKVLADRGWRPGRTTGSHTTDSERTLCTTNCVSKKSYFRCLAELDQLLAQGLSALAIKEPEPCYRCCLLLPDKRTIASGRPATDYKYLLGQAGVSEALVVRDIDMGVLEDDLPRDRLGRRRQLQALVDAPAGGLGQDDEEDVVVGALGVPTALAESVHASGVGEEGMGGLARRASSDNAAGDNSPSSSADSGPAAPSAHDSEDEVAGQSLPQGLAFESVSGVFPAMEVEGCRVSEEMYKPASRPAYHRLYLVCPLSCACHIEMGKERCRKYRNVSTWHERFGPLAVVAFLGAWARKASDFPSRSPHIGWNPPLSEVREYLRQLRP